MRTSAKLYFPLFCAGLLAGAALLTGCGRRQPTLSAPLLSAQEAIQAEDWPRAEKHLQNALVENPASITALLNLAMVQWQADKPNAAIATFNQIIELEAVPPIAWQLYAQLQLEAGNPHATRELLENITVPTPATLTLSAIADMEMQAYERARLTLENALDLDPAYAPAWYHLALVYRDHLDNRVEAQIAFRQFRQFAPADPRAAMTETLFSRTGTAAPPENASTPDEPAVPATTQTVAQANQTPTPDARPASPDDPIQTTLAAARQAIARGDTDTALITLKELVQQHPNNPDAVWALARFYDQQLELHDRADGLYATFRQLFPQDPRITEIPRRTPIPPPTTRPTGSDTARQSMLFQQGVAHFSKAEWDEAITAFRRVLAIAPDNAGAAFNLGLAYHKTRDYDAAAAAFRQALEHETDMIKSLYMLGLTERDRNNIPEALRLLNRVIRMQPDFAKAHQILGFIYLQEGRPDMTAIHFQRILEIDPTTEEAQRARAWLERQQANP